MMSKLKFFTFAFSIVCTFLTQSCDSDMNPEDEDDKSTAQSNIPVQSPIKDNYSEDAVASNSTSSGPKAKDSGYSFRPLGLADVYTVALDDPRPVYKSSDLEKVLCDLAPGAQVMIMKREEFALKIRLDRVAEIASSCPTNQQVSGYVAIMRNKYEPSQLTKGSQVILAGATTVHQNEEENQSCTLPGGTSIVVEEIEGELVQVSVASSLECLSPNSGLVTINLAEIEGELHPAAGADSLTPKSLTYDLKIYASTDKLDPPLCKIAKGNPVLVNEDETSIQIPVSMLCDETKSLGYYRFSPGMWLEDQPN